jgi:choline dehydrogenase-like flavoprotein
MLAVMAHIVIEEPDGSGIAAARRLLTSLQRGHLRTALMHNLLPMLRGGGDILRLLWSSQVRHRRAVGRDATVRLHIDMEQRASSGNRIRLSDHVDALGLRKAVVDWRVDDAEVRTGALFAQVIEREWMAAGLPKLDWLPGLLDGSIRPTPTDTYHAMGGLRMGDDPAASVVDRNLRVHGVANLYAASCAVYPSGGSSNPTFTLIALAMRLADQLLAQEREL